MRTKQFNVPAALHQAVLLFWRQGYAGTSMQALVQAMGINRQSIYDTFGDKHQLFLAALQNYYDMTKTEISAQLALAPELSAKLQTIFKVYTYREGTAPKGCLIVNSATELGLVDAAVRNLVAHYFATEKKLLRQVLQQNQAALQPDSDFTALASFLQNALVGVRVQARLESPTLATLINTTIAALPWKEA